MARRKPVPSNPTASLSPTAGVQSHSTSPSTVEMPSVLNEGASLRADQLGAEGDSSEQNVWASGAMGGAEVVPIPLHARDGKPINHVRSTEDIPESLCVGVPSITPHSFTEVGKPIMQPTNPYIRRQQTGQSASSEGKEFSANAWGGSLERSSQRLDTPPPPPLPKDTPPETNFANLSILEPTTNPWQPPLGSKSSFQSVQSSSIHGQDRGNEAWLPINVQSRPPPPIPTDLISLPSEESHAWDEEARPISVRGLPSDPQLLREKGEGHNIWEGNNARGKQQSSALAAQQAAQEEYLRKEAGGWESELQLQENGTVFNIDDFPEHQPILPATPPTGIQASTLTPPLLEEVTPPMKPQRHVDMADSNSLSNQDPSRGGTRQQQRETYEIKKVAWYDATASSNFRISPILVQNANGPCPLLALVNALCLSTPAELNTALVETLRSREQISLGLLLDAVFDELMSGRRGGAAQELPDVGDLYAFLVTLHTGMNVNPLFFPSSTSLMGDSSRPMSQAHLIEREDALPGTFENTREMTLYSTFNIPLIHGWLAAKGTPAYSALSRSARSYEDAQNLMFREEELEEKLQREGLSFEEQATLEDIATIRAFFMEHATQLTPYGLEAINHSIPPGSVAILFRNDHFSTLYRHPHTHQLFHLVTDMGYARHEEIVWESLADVSGENSEFLSGDFRIVGGTASTHGNDSEWTIVSSGRGYNKKKQLHSHGIGNDSVSSPATTNEQEDHDLALALQLQDEEEERHRNEISRRRRESQLSQQYIEQQASRNVPATIRDGGATQSRGRGVRIAQAIRPTIPPRRNNTPAADPPVDPESGLDAPPPSYEQAATAPVYNPPPNHPAHPTSTPASIRGQPSAYTANAATYGAAPAISRPRNARSSTASSRSGGLINDAHNARRSSLTQSQQQDREKDCIVM